MADGRRPDDERQTVCQAYTKREEKTKLISTPTLHEEVVSKWESDKTTVTFDKLSCSQRKKKGFPRGAPKCQPQAAARQTRDFPF